MRNDIPAVDGTRRGFRRWVKAAGVFNLVSSFPLAMPFLYERQYRFLDAANDALGLGGAPIVAPREGVNMLFVNTGGLILCSVGLMLLYAAGDLKHRRGVPFYNALTRIVWAALVVYYVVGEDLARILLTFAATDLLFAAALLYYDSKERRTIP